MQVYVDPNKRHDFVYLFDVQNGNPNGDPDAGNLPRVDPETSHGLVSDVALKRKVRDYVDLTRGEQDRFKIYVQSKVALNALHRRAYRAKGFSVGEPVEAEVPTGMVEAFADAQLPDGFSFVQEDAARLRYTGELDRKELKEALEVIKEYLGDQAAKWAADTIAKKAKAAPKLSQDDTDKVKAWMCDNFYDIRMFGAVMSTGVNAGQVRGPVQLTFGRSLDPITPLDLSITRVAITREEDKATKNTEMGRKTLIPYGLYRAHGFYSPFLGRQTGVTEDDLHVLWEALTHMFEFDRSASRGEMTCRGIYVFSHDSDKGNAPAHKLFNNIGIADGVKPARSFSDYRVDIEADLGPKDTVPRSFRSADGVTLTVLAEG